MTQQHKELLMTYTYIYIHTYNGMYACIACNLLVNAISVTFIWLLNCLLPFGIHFCRLNTNMLKYACMCVHVYMYFCMTDVCVTSFGRERFYTSSPFKLPRVFLVSAKLFKLCQHICASLSFCNAFARI